jgi:triosephosphate isomerase
MRTTLVAGNWKLNLGPAAAVKLARQVALGVLGLDGAGEVLVCPTAVCLPAVADVLRGSKVRTGAQNCAAEASGAFTGEVSADMLAEVGVRDVIVAHSERRSLFGEVDDDFVRKIDRCHEAGLRAIFCFGEVLAERRAGREKDVVRAQLTGVLPRLSAATAANLVLAYEPVWAIGTGETASPEQAQEIHAHSRAITAELLGGETARALRILYGGSVKPDNAADLFGRPDIDGGLIGGASLKAEAFLDIVRAAR